MDDDAIRTLVTRLARPDRATGGHVIERAAILAEGADFDAVMRWITDRDGVAEAPVATASRGGGLHGGRFGGGAEQVPHRFILPAGALD